jgi:chromosome segregation ATPase
LISAKDLFEQQRKHNETKKLRLKDLHDKLMDGEKLLQTQVTTLENQNDKTDIEIQEKERQIALKTSALKSLISQNQALKTSNRQKESYKDESFAETTKTSHSNIISLLTQIQDAKKEMETLLHTSVTSRQTLSTNLHDLDRKISSASTPTYPPSSLVQAQKEQKELMHRLEVLLNSRKELKAQISSAEEQNFSLEKQLKPLVVYKEVDKVLEEEIEQNSEKIKQSETVQKEIYADNVQKMKMLQQYEIGIEKYNSDITLLYQVVNLLKEFIDFNARDLDEKIRQLEDGIITIDDGSGRLDVKVKQVRDRVESPTYLDSLQRIIDKIKRLQDNNLANSNTKDELREQLKSQEQKISKTDLKTLTIEQIQSQKGKLSKIERAIDASENIKNGHMAEYERLINEFGDLKQDMQNNYEAKIKTVQVRHDEWLEGTTALLTI